MHKKSQPWIISAALAGVALMGVAGWWVGGLGASKSPGLPVAEAAPEILPPVAGGPPPVTAADPGQAVSQGAVTLDGQPVPQMMQFTIQTDNVGNLVLTGMNGQPVNQPPGNGTNVGPAVSATTLTSRGVPTSDIGRIGVVVNRGGPTVVMRGGNLTPAGVVNGNGTVTTVTLHNADGSTSRVTGTGTLIINGQNITVRPQAQVEPRIEAGQAATPPVTPGLP